MSEHRLYREVETIHGMIPVAVNRRGCTGEWTPAMDAMLAELVRAVVDRPATTSPRRASPGPETPR